MIDPKEKQQLKLDHFADAFDIPLGTARDMVHIKDFPSFKLGKSWYVDVPGFYRWREEEHMRRYKYARPRDVKYTF